MPAAPAVPLHDWTRVSAGKWHDMHLAWTGALRTELNSGGLPDPFFALVEPVLRQRPGETKTPRRSTPDVWVFPHVARPAGCLPADEVSAQFAAVERLDPPRTRRHITVRHPDGDRVVAIIEFASPGNRDAVSKVGHFAETLAAALEAGIHAVLIDPFPPTGPAPDGLHGAVAAEFGGVHRLDPARPLTFVGYRAVAARGDGPTAAVEARAAGESPPEVPLFLDPAWFVPLDLAPSYAAAFRGCPKPVRERLTDETL